MFIKSATIIKNNEGSHTTDFYVNDKDKADIKWIPINRVSSITGLDRKTIIKNIGRSSIKRIEYEDTKIECVDALALLRLNKELLDTTFYESILSLTIWTSHYFYKANTILKALPLVKGYIDNNEYLEREVSFYDRLQNDIYHDIENGNTEMVNELKVCLNLRRKAKNEKEISSLFEGIADGSTLDSITRSLRSLLTANETKKYNSRLTKAEKKIWKEKYEFKSDKVI